MAFVSFFFMSALKMGGIGWKGGDCIGMNGGRWMMGNRDRDGEGLQWRGGCGGVSEFRMIECMEEVVMGMRTAM